MLTPQSESRCDFVQDELVITELDRRPQIPYNQAKSLNLIKITVKFLFGLVTPLRPYQKKFLFLQKFLEYFVHINTAFFCTLSYPEDASKINAKHFGFKEKPDLSTCFFDQQREAIRSKISPTKESMIFMDCEEISVSGCTCFKTLYM